MSILNLLPKKARLPIICALLLPSVLLIAAAIQAQRSEDRLVLSYRWVQHTREVEARLQEVNLYATRLAVRADRPADLQSLLAVATGVRELTRENPEQQQAMAVLDEKIRQFTSGPRARSVAALDEVGELSNRMWREEERLLKIRQQSLLTRIRMRTFYLWALVIFNAALLGGLLLLVRRLTRLERFVHVCAWSRTIEFQGEWVSFETYLERRFKIRASHGIAPEEAERLLAELGAPAGKAAS